MNFKLLQIRKRVQGAGFSFRGLGSGVFNTGHWFYGQIEFHSQGHGLPRTLEQKLRAGKHHFGFIVVNRKMDDV